MYIVLITAINECFSILCFSWFDYCTIIVSLLYIEGYEGNNKYCHTRKYNTIDFWMRFIEETTNVVTCD